MTITIRSLAVLAATVGLAGSMGFAQSASSIQYVVDASAHRISSHRGSVERPEHLRYRSRISESRVQPEIVVIRTENYRHSVVNIGQERIRCGRKDRATLDHLSLRVCPPVPKAREGKQLAVVYFEAVRAWSFHFSATRKTRLRG